MSKLWYFGVDFEENGDFIRFECDDYASEKCKKFIKENFLQEKELDFNERVEMILKAFFYFAKKKKKKKKEILLLGNNPSTKILKEVFNEKINAIEELAKTDKMYAPYKILNKYK
jgi:hypothetical protein